MNGADKRKIQECLGDEYRDLFTDKQLDFLRTINSYPTHFNLSEGRLKYLKALHGRVMGRKQRELQKVQDAMHGQYGAFYQMRKKETPEKKKELARLRRQAYTNKAERKDNEQ